MIRDDNLTTIITSEKYGEGVRGILAKCFYGLILLTRIGVIHGDPHFDNVLLHLPSNQIVDVQTRIIDFGRSKFMNPNERATFSGIYENFLTGATLENFKMLANYIYELNNQIFIHFHQARYDLRYGWIINETILELIFPLVVMECAREAAHNGNGAMQAAQPDNGNGAIQAEQHDNGNESNEPNTKKRKATDVLAKGIHRRSKKRKNPKNRTKRK
jgi:serine/threonine protein kinase